MVVINIDILKSMTLYNEMSSTKLTFRQQRKRTMVLLCLNNDQELILHDRKNM